MGAYSAQMNVYLPGLWRYHDSKEESRGVEMSVEERIRRCLILEDMMKNREAAKELGLKNISRVKPSLHHLKAGKGKGR